MKHPELSHVDAVLKAPTRKERELVTLYYAIDDENPYSLEEVARILKIIRSRARQLNALGEALRPS